MKFVMQLIESRLECLRASYSTAGYHSREVFFNEVIGSMNVVSLAANKPTIHVDRLFFVDVDLFDLDLN